jgi:hypothetical protein
LTPKEYEQLVAENVTSDFASFENAELYRNKRFEGIRQPGKYEIDVAVRISIAGAVDYLTIFECKHLNRKVDRPIVQKLIQTRDAISAHKCVVVTNKGYTEEAIQVARANGVGLWLIGKDTRVTIMGFSGPEDIIYKIVEFRNAFARIIGYKINSGNSYYLENNEYCHADPMFEAANFINGPATVYPVAFDNERDWLPAFTFSGSRVPDEYSVPHINVRHSMCEFFNDLFDRILEIDCEERTELLDMIDEFIEVTNEYREQPLGPCATLPKDVVSTVFKTISLPLNGTAMSLLNLEQIGKEEFFFSWERTEHLNSSTIIM